MTTDPTPLQERIARAIRLADTGDSLPDGFAERMWDDGVANRDKEMRLAAAVLPILAAEVRAAKAEALRNLPPHLSLKIHQCPARESGGTYCALEKGHSGDHRVLDVPDGWVLGAVDRYIERIETEDQT